MSQLLMKRPSLHDLPAMPVLPDGMMLRLYEDSDQISLASLLRLAFQDEGWTPNRVTDALVNADDVAAIYVIREGNQVIATASARLLPDSYPGSGYVHWVAASPSHRGKRLGYLVSLAVLHEFVRLGCRDAVLETDDDRLPALKTYLSLGFVPEYRDASHADRWAVIQTHLSPAAP